MLYNEVSTFFLNYRIFLLDFKLNGGTLYMINGMCFALSFFIFRIILNTVIAFYIFKIATQTDLLEMPPHRLVMSILLVAMFSALYVLNIIWFKGIVHHVKRAMSSSAKHANSSEGEREHLN